MLMHQKKKFAFMFVLIGCAASVKLTALIFIPLLIRKETLRYLWFALLPLVMVVLYGTSANSLITVTGRFASEFHFNGFLYGILVLFFSYHNALVISTVIFLGAYSAVIFLTPDPIRACGNVALAISPDITNRPPLVLRSLPCLPSCIRYVHGSRLPEQSAFPGLPVLNIGQPGSGKNL